MEAIGARGAVSSVRETVRSDARSLARGLTSFVLYSALYAATMIDALAPFPIGLNIASAIANGFMIAMLFIIGHDCCHGAFVPGRSWNLWIGRLSFIPVVHSVSLWRVAHNGNHHGRTNLKGVDPVWTPMSPAEYAAASPARRWLERVYRSAFGPVIYYHLAIWLPLMIAPIWPQARAQWRRHLPDTLWVLAGFAATLTGVGMLGSWLAPERPLWLIMTLGWALPFAVWSYFAAFTVYLNHTHPDIAWFGDEAKWSAYNGSVMGTAHVHIPIDIFPLYTDVMAHPAHHANATTPVYALPEAQAELKTRVGQDGHEYTLTPGTYMRIVRTCKLFDYERMCWTGFDGVPMTRPLAVKPADFVPARISLKTQETAAD
jgi:omega-6 fatty acid desaturase (delta-12 desaturase)